MSGIISAILPDSIAAELGLAAGDTLLAINGQPIRDLIDYNYHSDSDYLELEIQRADGEVWVCEVDKYPEEELGLVFAANVFNGVRSCRNHCLFCFIDQLPPNPRPSLRLKDDDYRMSFLEGNFITCTNLSEDDYQRIGQLHLSPLYVSIHCIDPILRQRLLGRRQPTEILLTLQRLISLGARIHGQIVLCPGINDGAELERTIDALHALRPGIASLAIVPVGLTRYQRHPELRLFTPTEAAALIDAIDQRQRRYLAADNDPFVFLADEFYLKANRPFPLAELYGEFSQLENGVGMASRFLDQWQQARRELPASAPPLRIGVLTGVSGQTVLAPVVDQIRRVSGADLTLIPVENRFFGPTVTAAGLVSGSCIRSQVEPGRFDRLLLPSSMLKFDQDLFLDGMTLAELGDGLRCQLRCLEPDPFSLLAAIFEEDEA